jgi:crotonobetainyl-CoA:carnitine CoA-transferase CaiB-like acyl-CoA transferase
MSRLDLGYEVLREVNPALIFCSLSGYGQTGPYRSVPGHDMNYLGVVGGLQLSSRPETGPIIPGMLIADIGGGTLMATFGILAALMARLRTGRGQFVDVSMTDGAMTWMISHAASYLFGALEPRGGEERNIGGAPCYNIYRCADGRYITLGLIEAHFWDRFCELVHRHDLKGDAFPQQPAAAEAVRQQLAEIFLTNTCDEWVKLLWKHDIPAGPVNSFAEAFADPQMRAREMLQYVDHPTEGRIPQIGFPVKFSDTPGEMRLPPPCLGEHTDQILREIGYTKMDIELMRTSNVV